MILNQTITAGAGTFADYPCFCADSSSPTGFCQGGPCTHTLTTYSDQYRGPAFYPLCERCASRVRRLEIDAWLQQEGAVVIRVEDLGAALEAATWGRLVTHSALLISPEHAEYMASNARHAAHLARRALGLGERS